VRFWPIVIILTGAFLVGVAAADAIWVLAITVPVLGVYSVGILVGVDRSAANARRALDEASARLRRLEHVATVSIHTGPLDPILKELISRLRVAMEADYALLLISDGQMLTVRAADGENAEQEIGRKIPYGEGLFGRVATSGVALSISGTEPDLLAVTTVTTGIRSATAAPMKLNGTLIGVVAIGHAHEVHYDSSDVALLEIAGDRMATAIDTARLGESEWRASLGAARAREHMRMLGDTSRVLLRSVDDYEGPLIEVISTVVGDFATLAAVLLADGVGDGDLRVVAARLRNADEPVTFAPDELEPIRRAMASGKGRLRVLNFDADEDYSALTDQALDAAMEAMDLTSYVIAPIQVRGLAFGALLFGTGRQVRGYRPADQVAINDLAQRVALAIEANLLYREARHNAAATARHMQRLRVLLDTKLAIAPDASRTEILRTTARGAGKLFADSHVVVAVGDDQYDGSGEPVLMKFSPDAVATLGGGAGLMRNNEIPRDQLPLDDLELLGVQCVLVPLPPVSGVPGFVLLNSTRPYFSDEDESLLSLLARMMATSIVNEALNEETRSGEARMQAIFGASPAAIVTLTTDLKVHDCNPAAADLFDWDLNAEELEFPEQLKGCIADLTQAVTYAHEPLQADLSLPVNGVDRALILMLAPAWTEASSDRGYVLVITDDTERQQLANQYQQAQRLEAIGRLAGGIAHDFNNLLTVIQGYTDGLLRRLDGADPNRERIAAIHRAGQRGAALTRQLLTISRQEVVTPIVLRPAAVIDEIIDMLRKMVGESVRVAHLSGDDDARVSIDKLKLEQALLNLAANARDAMPDGGDLMISVHRTETPPRAAVTVPADADGEAGAGWVELRVTDTGVGMDDATLARCLDPLFTTKEPGAGTGLGLSTTYAIATANGGDVTITSSPGRGTTVTIVLPAVEAALTEEDETPLPTPTDTGRVGSGTILLVEDDHEIRWMVLRMLRERGYNTIAADNGLDAVQLMRENIDRIDVLLTDVAMPGMSGPEVARAVRAVRPVPVLFMSGYAEKLSAADRGDYPAEFLAKPFRPDDLAAAIERTMRLGRLHAVPDSAADAQAAPSQS
jgi:signal transduction histidine kinase/CheY-like chemotaxis protein/transcriptional regulator with GAF, ATPase, and Fis domain